MLKKSQTNDGIKVTFYYFYSLKTKKIKHSGRKTNIGCTYHQPPKGSGSGTKGSDQLWKFSSKCSHKKWH